MAEIHGGPLPHIPDDVTIGQFLLESQHPTRAPWTDAQRAWLWITGSHALVTVTGSFVGAEEHVCMELGTYLHVELVLFKIVVRCLSS